MAVKQNSFTTLAKITGVNLKEKLTTCVTAVGVSVTASFFNQGGATLRVPSEGEIWTVEFRSNDWRLLSRVDRESSLSREYDKLVSNDIKGDIFLVADGELHIRDKFGSLFSDSDPGKINPNRISGGITTTTVVDARVKALGANATVTVEWPLANPTKTGTGPGEQGISYVGALVKAIVDTDDNVLWVGLPITVPGQGDNQFTIGSGGKHLDDLKDSMSDLDTALSKNREDLDQLELDLAQNALDLEDARLAVEQAKEAVDALENMVADVEETVTINGGKNTYSIYYPEPADGAGKPLNAMWQVMGSDGKTLKEPYIWDGTEWSQFGYGLDSLDQGLQDRLQQADADLAQLDESLSRAEQALADMEAGFGTVEEKADQATIDAREAHNAAVEAQEKADEALAQLKNKPDKSYVDDQIIISANGKNSITTSLNAPSGTGINGDLWRRHDSSGHVYQEFTWRDGSWKPTMVTSEMVTNMDIHKLTVSGDATFNTLVADEIWSEVVKARLVVATELIAGDAIIKNTLSADRLKAKTITAQSGVIADATIGTAQIQDAAVDTAKIQDLSVTSAKIQEINAGKITSGYIDSARIDANSISADKIMVGAFDNLFHDIDFTIPGAYTPFTVVNKGLQGTISSGQTRTKTFDSLMRVEKNRQYNITFFKTNVSGNAGATLKATVLSATGATVDEQEYNTGDEQGEFQFTVSTLETGYNIRLTLTVSTGSGTARIENIGVYKIFDGTLIKEGSINTGHIVSGAITSEEILAESIGAEHIGAGAITSNHIGARTIQAENIGFGVITGDEVLANSITGNNIDVETITAENLAAGSVTFEKIALHSIRGENLVDGGISEEDLLRATDSEVNRILNSAKDVSHSVIIEPDSISLTTGGEEEDTSLILTSTRQSFRVDGKEVVYIDSVEEAMNIKNVKVEKTIQVGNHVIDSLSNDLTVFTWAGDQVGTA